MGAAFCPSVYSQDKDDTGAIPSNSQAWEKLALILIFICVCEYLLHVAAQRLDGGGADITLREPTGILLHSWWFVSWDLYLCSSRDCCEDSSKAKVLCDYSARTVPHAKKLVSRRCHTSRSSWYPGGPRPPLSVLNQVLGGIPGSQPLLPSRMDPHDKDIQT